MRDSAMTSIKLYQARRAAGATNSLQPLESWVAKNPDDRPRSAHELSAMLDACRLGEWTQEEARVWWAGRQVARAWRVLRGALAQVGTAVRRFTAELLGRSA